MPKAGKRIVGLYGAGGFAREIMPFVRDRLTETGMTKICFIETEPRENSVNDLPVVSEDEFFSSDFETRQFAVAIADASARKTIAERCELKGATPIRLQAPNATVYDNNHIGDGAILCANTVITSNVRIGRHFHANLFSYVAHDCVIGDYVTFAPRVNCNGNVHIGDYAYIGTGAVLRQGTPDKPLVIGEEAIVGMGAVVTKDVPPHTTVVGNPARPLVKNP